MPQPSVEFMLFALDEQRFGIRIADVQEIVRAVSVTKLPQAPAAIEGVIDLRGSVIPVLDIRARFHLPARPVEGDDHLVIACADTRKVGIRVDRAIDILPLNNSEIDGIAGIAPTSDYVAGIARRADGLVLIHDLSTFLSDTEAREVDAALEQRRPS